MLRSTLKLLVLLASFSSLAACGGDDGDSGPDCTDTAQQMRGSMVIASACTSCHSQASTNRMNAPANVNFDGAADIDTHEARIRARAIDGQPTPMPPGAPLSATQKADLEAYLDCRE